jgi:hypothetical protein
VLILLALLAAPLGLRTQGPLRELFLDVTIADARPLVKPELDVRYTMANTWNEFMTLQRGDNLASQELDEQADSIAVKLTVPWPGFPRVWSALEWRITEHWGGWSDRPIEAWHSLIGAFNYQRSINPRNEVHMLYQDDGGTAFNFSSAKLAPGDVTVRTQVALVDAPVALAARFDFKLPTGPLSSAGGSGGGDAGAGVVATWPFSGWGTLYGLFALSRFSHLDAPTLLQPRAWHWTWEVSFEAKVSNETALYIEDRLLSPLLETGWKRLTSGVGGDDAFLSSGYYADFRSHNQISFGLRSGRFAFWLSEDFTPGSNPHSIVPWLWVSNAPDVVLGVSFTQPLSAF